MFGNIARWLRTLGYDTIYAGIFSTDENKSRLEDNDLINECLINHRILITRDLKLINSLENRFFKKMEENPEDYDKYEMAVPKEYGMITPCIFLRDTKLMDGLEKIYQEFRINLLYDADNARCSKCNSTIIKIKRKEDYINSIPEGVYLYQKDFWRCLNNKCGQIYWKGSQMESVVERLKTLRSK